MQMWYFKDRINETVNLTAFLKNNTLLSDSKHFEQTLAALMVVVLVVNCSYFDTLKRCITCLASRGQVQGAK
jgi:hypothetical protein